MLVIASAAKHWRYLQCLSPFRRTGILDVGEKADGMPAPKAGMRKEAAPVTGPARRTHSPPQQFLRPQAVSLDSRPFIGLSLISSEPVLMKPVGFLPDLAYSATASTPATAIL